MSARNPDSFAYHPDFTDVIVSKDHGVALRLLETADIALSFARALVAKEFEKANAMLAHFSCHVCQTSSGSNWPTWLIIPAMTTGGRTSSRSSQRPTVQT
jgi:hypothetical protein